MKHAITALSFISAAALFATAGSAQTVPVAGEVVISAVYGGGGNSGARFQHDFIELFNRSTSAKDISGFTVQRTSAGGGFPVAAGAVNISLPFPAGTILQPGQYTLVRCASGAGTGEAMPTPFIDNTANSGGLTISATGAKILLVSNSSGATAFNGASVIDFMSYGATNGEASPLGALTNTTAAFRKGAGCNDTDNSLADFEIVSVAVGTTVVPRTTASPANVCGLPVPDLALSLATGACGLTSGSSVTIVASATNPGTAAANGSVVTITLPTSVTNVAAPGATVAGNVITWNPGNLPALTTTPVTLNITATVNTQGTFVATATAPALSSEVTTANNSVSARNFVAFSGPGYSTPVTPLLVAVPAAYETANGFNAGSLGVVNDLFATPLKMRSIVGRPVASANGSRFVFWTNTEAGDTGGSALNLDGLLVTGSLSGGSASLLTVAAESATAVDPANPGRVVRAGVNFPAAITAPAINNAGDFVFATQTIGSGETNPTSVVAQGNVSNPTVFTVLARQGDAAAAAGAGINWGPAVPATGTTVFNSTTLTNSGAAAFTGTLSGAGVTTANDFIAVNGGVSAARKGVTVPTGLQGTNTGAAITSVDASAAAALGFSVDAAGSNILVSGLAKLGAGTTADDAFVAVNGNVVLQEGFPIAGSGISDNVASFDSAMMQPDGSWYAVGALSTGTDFVVRNGTVLAKTGDVIATGSTETWDDAAVARTFTGFTSNGNDSVIFGLTSNTDTATDNVAVWQNGSQSQVLFREGQPITVNGRQFYANFLPANRGQAWITADRKLVTLVTLYEGSNVCTNTFTNTVNALVSVDLPATGPSCNNPSNVAGPNQSTTPDASLTADDIIVFLGWFFANDSRANVAGPNQSTIPDNSFTADDIIVFLGRYFQGC